MNLLNFLFPEKCVSCKKLGSYFCQKCTRRIEFITSPICPICARPAIDGATHPICLTPWGIDGMYALSHYKGPIRDATHLLKYRFVSDLAASVVGLLVSHYPTILPKFDFLTAVPLHPKREKFRGFNQSQLITEMLGKKLQISVKDKILKRVRTTRPQVELKGSQRTQNIIGAFALDKDVNINGATIGLVDDVATTRSTLVECAKVLKRNGAKAVWGIVLAHG